VCVFFRSGQVPEATVVLEVEGLHGGLPALEEPVEPAGLRRDGAS
jgi:hypothetical protein